MAQLTNFFVLFETYLFLLKHFIFVNVLEFIHTILNEHTNIFKCSLLYFHSL